jgi:competence protein ComEC
MRGVDFETATRGSGTAGALGSGWWSVYGPRVLVSRGDAGPRRGLTEAAVVRGMVLGDRPLIPEELEDAFQRSGVTHVLAISGQHLAILAAVVFFGLRLVAVPPHARAGVTVLLTRLYIVVAGRHPPPSGPAWSPRSCWRQSSSGARSRRCTLRRRCSRRSSLQPAPRLQQRIPALRRSRFGILLLRDPLNALVERTVLRMFDRPPRAVSNLISVSLAAQVSTAPIVTATFDEVSTVGVLTNLIAVPISGPILTLGLLGSLLGNVAPSSPTH